MSESDFSEFRVPVSNEEDIEFIGKKLGSASGTFEDEYGKVRTEDLSLYCTKANKIVVERSVEYSDNITRHEAFIYEDPNSFCEKVKRDLGASDAAKEICEIATASGIEVKMTRRIE